MIALDRLWSRRDRLLKEKGEVQDVVAKILSNPANHELIVGTANTAQAVTNKINLVEKALKAI